MGESTNQIEQDIAAERHELGRNLQLLENKAKSLTDWRTHFRSHPLAMIAVGLGGGVLLGVITRRSVPSTRRSVPSREPRADLDTDDVYAVVSPFSASATRVRRQVGDTWDHIADALLGVAFAKAIDFIGERVPGFREQYSVRHPEQRVPFSTGVRNG
jgi:hypothetical protein